MTKRRSNADDLRGAARLAIEGTTAIADAVEAMHRAIDGGPPIFGNPLAGPLRGMTKVAYGSVRGVTKLVGEGIDRALAQFAPLLGDSLPGRRRQAVLAALNGTLGDYLLETDNPLAIQMRLRQQGQALELEPDVLSRTFPHASSKLVLLVHGSSMNDLQWTRLAHNHGEALAHDLGYTPIGVHYNSGLHISTNGQELAELLELLVNAWPVAVEEIALLGHSMGGLVARSACHYGLGRRWRSRAKQLVCLATPHHGARLEQAGNWVQMLLGVSRYSAPLAHLGKIRSAGVTDLRFGNVLDEDWIARDRFQHAADSRHPLPLPADMACFAIAGTTALVSGSKLPGDGLVSVDSALGRHSAPELALGFPNEHQWIAFGVRHLDLLARVDTYERIRDWLRPSRS